jgi:hypothetical protein
MTGRSSSSLERQVPVTSSGVAMTGKLDGNSERSVLVLLSSVAGEAIFGASWSALGYLDAVEFLGTTGQRSSSTSSTSAKEHLTVLQRRTAP